MFGVGGRGMGGRTPGCIPVGAGCPLSVSRGCGLYPARTGGVRPVAVLEPGHAPPVCTQNQGAKLHLDFGSVVLISGRAPVPWAPCCWSGGAFPRDFQSTFPYSERWPVWPSSPLGGQALPSVSAPPDPFPAYSAPCVSGPWASCPGVAAPFLPEALPASRRLPHFQAAGPPMLKGSA